MIDKNTGYYHCLECGALFQAEIKAPKDQRCLICGEPPTGQISLEREELQSNKNSGKKTLPTLRKYDPEAQKSKDAYDSAITSLKAHKESRHGRIKRNKRRIKGNLTIFTILALWMVFMGYLISKKIVSQTNNEQAKSEYSDSYLKKKAQARQRKNEKKYLKTAFPLCTKTLAGFLNANTASGKNPYAYKGSTLIGKMNRYYKDKFIISPKKRNIDFISSQVLYGFKYPAIGGLYHTPDGLLHEIVFIKGDKGWKIDWPFFVRLDENSWSKFTSQEDGKEGVFRLYMRIRNTDENSQNKNISVVFYKPETAIKKQFEVASSKPVNILKDSDLGRKIISLKNPQKKGTIEANVLKDPHGLKIGIVDPPRYHRVKVRLKLHREGENGKYARLELLEILANDWYGDLPKKQIQ